jgi:hypothetical protein
MIGADSPVQPSAPKTNETKGANRAWAFAAFDRVVDFLSANTKTIPTTTAEIAYVARIPMCTLAISSRK